VEVLRNRLDGLTVPQERAVGVGVPADGRLGDAVAMAVGEVPFDGAAGQVVQVRDALGVPADVQVCGPVVVVLDDGDSAGVIRSDTVADDLIGDLEGGPCRNSSEEMDVGSRAGYRPRI